MGDGRPARSIASSQTNEAHRGNADPEGVRGAPESRLLTDLGRPFRPFEGIALPEPFERFRKSLLFHAAIDVHGVAGKHELVVIAFGGQNSGHVLAGNDPVVHVVAHDIWIQEISVSDFHPHSNRLDRTIRDQALVKSPCAVRSLRTMWPLLIYRGDRVCQYAVIEIRVIPCHVESP